MFNFHSIIICLCFFLLCEIYPILSLTNFLFRTWWLDLNQIISRPSAQPISWDLFLWDTLLRLDTLTFSSVQSLSCVWFFVTTWIAACQASLSIINSRSLLKLISIESVMPSNHLILCCPLLLLPSIFPSIRVFSNKSVLRIRRPKYWEFQHQYQSFQWIFRLISFRMDWLDLLAVQGTLKSLLQHHSSKASVLLHSAFFIVQFSHPYMTTEKNHSLD